MPDIFLLFCAAIIGTCLGSFANVVALRDNDRTSIISGRSKCPHCGHELAWFDLFPLLSYVIQGGHCRYCKKSISIRYPLVELTAAVVAVFLTYYVSGAWLLTGIGFATFLLFVVSLIDLQTYEIPVEYVAIAGVIGVIATLGTGTHTLSETALGAVSGGGVIAAILYGWKLFFKQDGMGDGDIWIAAAAGAIVGYPSSIVVLVVAVFAGALIGSAYAALAKKGLAAAIPFGPFLFLGFLGALVWGQTVVAWYILYL